MRIRRYIPRYVHMETWALGFALPFIKKPGQDPFPFIKRKTAHDPVAPNADPPPPLDFRMAARVPKKLFFNSGRF